MIPKIATAADKNHLVLVAGWLDDQASPMQGTVAALVEFVAHHGG